MTPADRRDGPNPYFARWRQGRKLGHTVYAMAGPQPSDEDVFLFTTHDEPLAEHICRVHNAHAERGAEHDG